ncbi:MAG: hypothetical protein K6G06_06195 [Butyrivibrio sp.]|nr:hypothetical protein [Butyrivibrio sp.]
MFFLRIVLTFIYIVILSLETVESDTNTDLSKYLPEFITGYETDDYSYYDEDEYNENYWQGNYDDIKPEDSSRGSAVTPDGKTVVVSIFVSEHKYKWDYDSDSDKEKISDINKYLGIAGDYIEDVVHDYGKEAEFVTDFVENPDLMYTVTLDEDMTNTDYVDSPAWEYIDSNVASEEIKEKYQADNVIYFMLFNTNKKSDSISCTRNWYTGMDYPYEVVYLYNMDYGMTNCPAVYAHEMLHTFGAPDLYQVSKDFQIHKDFVNYVEENLPNEIMLTCSDYRTGEYDYEKVTNEVSDLTAYYIGLIDDCDIVNEHHLAFSEHDARFIYNKYGW